VYKVSLSWVDMLIFYVQLTETEKEGETGEEQNHHFI
jgi:hypothetical protein